MSKYEGVQYSVHASNVNKMNKAWNETEQDLPQFIFKKINFLKIQLIFLDKISLLNQQ